MPINFNSENYSNQATEFYENLKRQDYEKNFSPQSLSDLRANEVLSNSIVVLSKVQQILLTIFIIVWTLNIS